MVTSPRGEPLLEHREFPVAHWRVTPASGSAHSEVILVHGLGEHAGRMMPVARQLASLGYNCRVPDLPGHGGCGGSAHLAIVESYLRGKDATEILDRIQSFPEHQQQEADEDNSWQLAALYRTSFEQIIETVQKLATWSVIDGNDADRPHFLWGHSMGGLACFHAACRIDRDFTSAPTGLILSAPAFAPPPQDNDLLLKLVSAQALLLSSFTVLKPIAALQRLCLRILSLEGDGRWASKHVSNAPAETLLHSKDPYHNHRIPLCFAARLLPAMAASRTRARNLRTPVFAFAPGYDFIVNSTGTRTVAACLPISIDPLRPHRLEIFEDMQSHDLARSWCGNPSLTRIHQWMQGRG
ncbi:MAG: hypothetical protein CMJ95_01785 [Planctomycetes bacterium]|nr:hypothetical protein [Planctomycetota bacterium]